MASLAPRVGRSHAVALHARRCLLPLWLPHAVLTGCLPRTCQPICLPDRLRERVADHLIWAALVVFVLLLSQTTSAARTP